MDVVLWIVGGLVALAFLAAGAAKLTGAEQMVANLEGHLGVSSGLRLAIGALEVAAGLAIALALVASSWEWLGLAAAIGLVLLMIGAVTYHLRAGDPPQGWAPPATLGALAAVTALLFTAS